MKTIEIHVEQENDALPQVELVVNGAAEKFELPALSNGETRTILAESGKTLIASKDEQGMTTIQIDGQDIKLFGLDGDHGANFNFIHDGDHEFTGTMDGMADKEVKIIRKRISKEQ